MLAKKKHLDEKRALNGGTVGSGESKEVEGPTVKCWKPGDKIVGDNGDIVVRELKYACQWIGGTETLKSLTR